MNYIDGNAKVKTTAESFAELIDETKKDLDKEDQIMLDTLEEKKNGSSDKDVFIYETEVSKHSVREPLTKDEKIKLADQMMEVEKEIQHQEGELEFHKSEIKAEIKALESKRKNLVEEYKRGTKEIVTDCYWRMNYPESGTKTLYRKDKEIVVKTAEMSAEDRQLTISMWQKVTGQEPEKVETDKELDKVSEYIFNNHNESKKTLDEVTNILLEAIEKYGTRHWADMENHLKQYGLSMGDLGDEINDMIIHAYERKEENSRVYAAWLKFCESPLYKLETKKMLSAGMVITNEPDEEYIEEDLEDGEDE